MLPKRCAPLKRSQEHPSSSLVSEVPVPSTDVLYMHVFTAAAGLQVVKGIVEGCRQSDCTLLGGEVCSCLSSVETPVASLHACTQAYTV